MANYIGTTGAPGAPGGYIPGVGGLGGLSGGDGGAEQITLGQADFGVTAVTILVAGGIGGPGGPGGPADPGLTGGVGASGGRGGLGSLGVDSVTLLSAAITVTGGPGGAGGTGGGGGISTQGVGGGGGTALGAGLTFTNNTVTAAGLTTQFSTTVQGGNGGNGGGGSTRGHGGYGGNASLTFTGNQLHFTTGGVSLTAMGGQGGSGSVNGHGGNASTTIADNSFTGSSGDDSLTAIMGATGGLSSLPLPGQPTPDAGSGSLSISGNTFDGGDGNDSLVLQIGYGGNSSSFVAQALSIDLSTGIFTFGSGSNTISHFENVNVQATGASADATLGLTAVFTNITLAGDGQGNILQTSSGNDTLNGGAGNDTLIGGQGNDAMTGGLGDDTFIVDSVGDTVVEKAGEGHDTVFSAVNFSLSGINAEDVSLTALAHNATGNSLNNVLTGNTSDNVLTGMGGNDTLDGGYGADTMIGGFGDDTFYVDNAADIVTELSGQGTDLVFSSVTFTLAGTFVENLTLTATDNIDATGNSLANTLTGNDGVNTLTGGAGNDWLDGGAGADILIGGKGDDTYTIDNAGDVVKEINGEGNDTILSSVSYSLAGTFVETLHLTGTAYQATGNGQDNILIGNDADNRFIGGFGHDTLTGGPGADAFWFGFGSGVDTITDFSASDNDRINIHTYTQGTENDLLLSQVGNDTVIDLGGGNVITVQNTLVADLTGHIVW